FEVIECRHGRHNTRTASDALLWFHANGSAAVGPAVRAARKGIRMLPTVLPRTAPAAAVLHCPPTEHGSEQIAPSRGRGQPERRRRPRPERPGQPVAQTRETTVPAVGSTVEETPLVRLREAMSRYQVDAILVVGREDGRPLRWMTKRGLVGEAARDSSRQAIGHVVSQFRGETSLEQLRELVREPDVSRVLVWCNSAPFAIVGA